MQPHARARSGDRLHLPLASDSHWIRFVEKDTRQGVTEEDT
jgi:hypothetical protein